MKANRLVSSDGQNFQPRIDPNGCVAAATFLPKSLKFWDPSFPFKAALIPFDP